MQILDQYLARIDDLGKEAQSTAHFAAGKAFNDQGKYAAAFDHFFKANEITKEIHKFDAKAYVERAERLRSFATPELLTRCGSSGVRDIAPIFITGMPRSGTTLMDQMFSRHPKVMAGGELRAMPAAMHLWASPSKAFAVTAIIGFRLPLPSSDARMRPVSS